MENNDEIKIERNENDKIENLEKISDNIFLTNTDYKNNERNLKEKENLAIIMRFTSSRR